VLKYEYQGQEHQTELGLNWSSFKYRNYDYAIGRFLSLDPLAEKFPYWSLYQFAGLTPIWARELEGLETWYTTKGDELVRIENVSGPISNLYAEQIGATHYGVLKKTVDFSFSNEEIQQFSDWNALNGSNEPGECIGAATTGAEIQTGTDAGFRNNNGNNDFSKNGTGINGWVTLFDVGRSLEEKGVAFEFNTSNDNVINSIISNSITQDTENTAYLVGVTGAYHSMIITRNTQSNKFSLFDQGTGWDIKNTDAFNAQIQLNDISSFHPNWNTRIWQLAKIKLEEQIIPYQNEDSNE